MKKIRVTGFDAIKAAKRDSSVVLHKDADTTTGALDRIEITAARKVAALGPAVIWAELEVSYSVKVDALLAHVMDFGPEDFRMLALMALDQGAARDNDLGRAYDAVLKLLPEPEGDELHPEERAELDAILSDVPEED